VCSPTDPLPCPPPLAGEGKGARFESSREHHQPRPQLSGRAAARHASAPGPIPRGRTNQWPRSSVQTRRLIGVRRGFDFQRGFQTPNGTSTMAHDGIRGSPDPERKPKWRGTGLLTQPQAVRNRRGPPFLSDH